MNGEEVEEEGEGEERKRRRGGQWTRGEEERGQGGVRVWDRGADRENETEMKEEKKFENKKNEGKSHLLLLYTPNQILLWSQ